MRYLSPEWFAAAREAVENDTQLEQLSARLDLTIEQTVTEGPDDTGPSSPSSPSSYPASVIQWHVTFDHGSVRLTIGPAEQADLRFRTSYTVAAAIARGELAAPVAFLRGELGVGGDLNLLTAHQQTFAALGDVLRETR